jgi:hypothetical protein
MLGITERAGAHNTAATPFMKERFGSLVLAGRVEMKTGWRPQTGDRQPVKGTLERELPGELENSRIER